MKKVGIFSLIILMVCTMFNPVQTHAENVAPGCTATLYNKGNKLEKYISGLSRKSLVTWLQSHEKDNYYIGTPYPERADGTIIGGSRGTGDTDNRNPNGDKNIKNGPDDWTGTPMMNCTGFVWHAIYKATGMSYDTAFNSIPCYANWYGGGRWPDFIENNKVEYKWYSASSTESLINGIAKDNYAQKGDIVWFWDDQGTISSTGIGGISGNNHIGFYWGDSSNRDKWWDSIGISKADNIAYLKNKISKMTPKAKSINAIVLSISVNSGKGKVIKSY